MKQKPMSMAYRRNATYQTEDEERTVKGYASEFILDYEQLKTPSRSDTYPAKFIIQLN
jgi:uncharacterized protein Veg